MLQSASRSMFALLKHTQIYRVQVESLVTGSLHNSRSLCRWGVIPSEGGGVQGKVSTGTVVEGKLKGNESIRASALTSPVL